jgi:hypothetical protein
VRCPKCDSENWKIATAGQLRLTGLMMFSFGIWLAIFLVGIPMMIVGFGMMVAPASDAYRCQRCHKVWRDRDIVGRATQ